MVWRKSVVRAIKVRSEIGKGSHKGTKAPSGVEGMAAKGRIEHKKGAGGSGGGDIVTHGRAG